MPWHAAPFSSTTSSAPRVGTTTPLKTVSAPQRGIFFPACVPPTASPTPLTSVECQSKTTSAPQSSSSASLPSGTSSAPLAGTAIQSKTTSAPQSSSSASLPSGTSSAPLAGTAIQSKTTSAPQGSTTSTDQLANSLRSMSINNKGFTMPSKNMLLGMNNAELNILMSNILPEDRNRFRQYLADRFLGIGLVSAVS
jgi:hypothetical protein